MFTIAMSLKECQLQSVIIVIVIVVSFIILIMIFTHY